MDKQEIRERYQRALDSFVDKIRHDQNVIAVIVYGSFSYDVVWDKSDIDMEVVVRDQPLETKSYCIDEDNIILNVSITQRSDMKRWLEKSTGGSVGHSFSSKAKIVYTTDDSLYEYFEEHKKIGKSDMERSFFFMSCGLLGYMHKIEKWIVVKEDLTYARYYVLKAVEVLAQMEVCLHYEIPTREAILQAEKLNPELIEQFYRKPMAGSLSKDELYALLAAMDNYLMKHIDPILNTVMECLGDGEIKTVTQITKYYKTNSHGIADIFEYLYEKGYIEKLSQTIRITPKSKMLVEEAAFLYVLQ